MRTEIVLFDGYEELDAFGPFEVFAIAGLAPLLVTAEPAARVTGANGSQVIPHAVMSERPGLLVVPGGSWSAQRPGGAWAQAEEGTLPRAIAARHRAGTLVAGVCSGVLLLGAAGLLEGRRAVTHHAVLDELEQAGARVLADARVVDDGDIVTCGGVTAGIDLALWIVERHAGAEAAERVATTIEYRRDPAVVHGATSPAVG
jgi:transcriptional regulator GlxA family with amidase domain